MVNVFFKKKNKTMIITTLNSAIITYKKNFFVQIKKNKIYEVNQNFIIKKMEEK